MIEKIASYLFISFLSFVRHFLGAFTRPYETYRELAKGIYPFEALFMGIIILGYTGISSLLRKGLHNPLLLTLNFGKISWGILFTFVFAWGALYFIGRLFGGKGTPQSLFLPWVYSLLPTLSWFIATSFFYLFLPPPRSVSIAGQLFSIFFIALTLTLFYWKGILYYLTLRFGHKLDLIKILLVSLLIFPLLIVYSLFTYRLGIFRVPFI